MPRRWIVLLAAGAAVFWTAGAVVAEGEDLDKSPLMGSEVGDVAIYSACDVHLEGNKTILEDVAGSHDAHIYAGCDLHADVNLASTSTFQGSFLARGDIYYAAMYLGGNIWARGDINGIGGACVGTKTPLACGYGDDPADYAGGTLEETGWIVSSQGNVNALGWVLNPCVAPNGTVTQPGGPALSCRLRDWVSGPDIYKLSSGAVPPGFFPSPETCPAAAAAVPLLGGNLCEDPPDITFPEWGYNDADWAGYTRYPVTSCAQAQADIAAGFPGSELVDLRGMSPDCDLTFNSGGTTNINGDLAIITEGAVHFQSTWWNGVGGTRKVMIIHPTIEAVGTLSACPHRYDGAGTATAYGADAQDDITFANTTAFTNIGAMFYTPCAVDLDNLSMFAGQIIAGQASISNNGNFQFRPNVVPGLGPVAPDTSIDTGPTGTVATPAATFTFASTEGGSTFECQLDGGGYSPCTTPKAYPWVINGLHIFQVRAIDPALNVDPSPASRTWTAAYPKSVTTLSITTPVSVPRNTNAHITGTLGSVNAVCIGGQSLKLKKGTRVLQTQLTAPDGTYDFDQLISRSSRMKVVYGGNASCRSASSVRKVIAVT